MCFGRALEMEGEFQVGEKCITTEEPEVMAIEMAKMTDAEICQVTQGGIIPPQGIPIQPRSGTQTLASGAGYLATKP